MRKVVIAPARRQLHRFVRCLGTTANKALHVAVLADVKESLGELSRIEKLLGGILKNSVQWLWIELSVAGGTSRVRFSIKPTKRLYQLLAAAEAPSSHDNRIHRSAPASCVASRSVRRAHKSRVKTSHIVISRSFSAYFLGLPLILAGNAEAGSAFFGW